MYLVFTCMPDETYRRRLRSLLLYLCYVFRAQINSLVCWEWVFILPVGVTIITVWIFLRYNEYYVLSRPMCFDTIVCPIQRVLCLIKTCVFRYCCMSDTTSIMSYLDLCVSTLLYVRYNGYYVLSRPVCFDTALCPIQRVLCLI